MATTSNDSEGAAGMGIFERLDAELASMRHQIVEMNQRMSSVESGNPAQVASLHVQLAPEAIEQIAAAVARLSATGIEALDEAFAAGGDDLAASLATLVHGEIERTLAEAGLDVVVTAESPQMHGENPVVQNQGVEAPVVAARVVAARVVAAPVAEAPVVETRVVAAPVAEAPVVAARVVAVPVVEARVVAVPVVAVPVVEAPVVEAPVVEAPIFEAEPMPVPHLADVAPVVSLAGAVPRNDPAPLHAGQPSGFGADDQDSPDAFSDDTERPPLVLAELDDPFLDALIHKEPLSA